MTVKEKMTAPEDAFEFGENWQEFIDKHLNEERIAEAIKSLVDFCGEDAIKDKVFLDIGCGSGLFSLAAYKLGAKKIISLDVDPNSVACCKKLKATMDDPELWDVHYGSILDEDFIQELRDQYGEIDFVYSWGVLHHTGSMWEAIQNAASFVKQGGSFYIAIYNNADGFQFMPDGRFGNSKLWLLEKRFYVNSPKFIQRTIDFCAMGAMFIIYLLLLRNPLSEIKKHKSLRGMSWSVDIRDWLGGYPYEYARADEIFNFVKPLGFRLENLKANNGLLNNDFLFTRMS